MNKILAIVISLDGYKLWFLENIYVKLKLTFDFEVAFWLFNGLLALAVILLIVGIYFLFRAIRTGKRKRRNNRNNQRAVRRRGW